MRESFTCSVKVHPEMIISPRVGISTVPRIFRRELFPEPDLPTIITNSPR